MEVAVMSLSLRERHALHSIEDRLCVSDPELASLLAMFARLTAGEDMPPPEKTQAGRRRASRCSRRNRWQPFRNMVRPRWPRVTRQGTGLVLAVLLVFGLLAAAMVLTGGGLGRGCPLPGTACAGQLPVHAASLDRAFTVR
jgi:hypothetical protein